MAQWQHEWKECITEAELRVLCEEFLLSMVLMWLFYSVLFCSVSCFLFPVHRGRPGGRRAPQCWRVPRCAAHGRGQVCRGAVLAHCFRPARVVPHSAQRDTCPVLPCLVHWHVCDAMSSSTLSSLAVLPPPPPSPSSPSVSTASSASSWSADCPSLPTGKGCTEGGAEQAGRHHCLSRLCTALSAHTQDSGAVE